MRGGAADDTFHPVVPSPQVLGESMAGISQHCKTGDVVAFGESVGVASKALCGLTEAAGQVSFLPSISAASGLFFRALSYSDDGGTMRWQV